MEWITCKFTLGWLDGVLCGCVCRGSNAESCLFRTASRQVFIRISVCTFTKVSFFNIKEPFRLWFGLKLIGANRRVKSMFGQPLVRLLFAPCPWLLTQQVHLSSHHRFRNSLHRMCQTPAFSTLSALLSAVVTSELNGNVRCDGKSCMHCN